MASVGILRVFRSEQVVKRPENDFDDERRQQNNRPSNGSYVMRKDVAEDSDVHDIALEVVVEGNGGSDVVIKIVQEYHHPISSEKVQHQQKFLPVSRSVLRKGRAFF